MQRTLFILLLLCTQNLFAQQFHKEDLLRDLNYLNEAVLNGHPMNYDPREKISIDNVISQARQLTADSISARDYTLWIEKGIYNIGSVHTVLRKNPLLKNRDSTFFIPLTCTPYQEELFITSCSDSTKVGRHIISINGKSIHDILKPYKEYKASDGKTDAFAREYFHVGSSRLISGSLSNPDTYEIKTREGDFTLKGSKEAFKLISPVKDRNTIISNGSNRLFQIGDFAILQVSTFQQSDKQFFSRAFKTIGDTKRDHLVIDLRQNLGGNRAAAVELTKYLSKSPFSYSILQPKLKTSKYLNGQGKTYFLLSKIKYNVEGIFRKHRSEFGKEFTYAYKPKKDNFYDGKIYVLTDGFTASASTMVTSWVKQFTNATFLGMQASGGYNGNDGGSFPVITLPRSKMEITFPAYRLILDPNSANRAGIIPGIAIQPGTEITDIIRMIQTKQR